MGFQVYYRSTQPLPSAKADAVRGAAQAANKGRTWLGCEPVQFFPSDDGHLFGGSKPNFIPHPDDVEAAAREILPNGTTRDMLDVLCILSRDHSVDWVISHDYSGGPIGHIRAGVCDPEVMVQIEAFADTGDILGELGLDTET